MLISYFLYKISCKFFAYFVNSKGVIGVIYLVKGALEYKLLSIENALRTAHEQFVETFE